MFIATLKQLPGNYRYQEFEYLEYKVFNNIEHARTWMNNNYVQRFDADTPAIIQQDRIIISLDGTVFQYQIEEKI